MRRLHGLLWYLAEALARPEAAPLYVEARALQWKTERLIRAAPDELTTLDVAEHSRWAGDLLTAVSERVRGRLSPGHVTGGAPTSSARSSPEPISEGSAYAPRT